jgi:hypothetical protein
MGFSIFGGNENVRSGLDSVTRPAIVKLTVLFKDTNNYPTNVTDARARLTKDDQPMTVETFDSVEDVNHFYPITSLGSTGMYTFTFLTNPQMTAGVYRVEFRGGVVLADNASHDIVVTGDVGIGEITSVQDYVNRVRMGLMDDFPTDYRLDEPAYQWTGMQIYTFLREAVDRINSTGPRRTSYTLEGFPPEIDEFLVTGAKIWALQARARLEKANEMNYTDGHSLSINRGDFYLNMASVLYRDWLEAIISWKKASPPTPIGLGASRLPFRLSRVIGMLPNSATIFGN